MHPITFQYANMYKGCIKCRGCRAQGCRGCRTQRCRWCRAQGCSECRECREAGGAGHRGVLGAGLRGSRIPESEGVQRAQGTGDAVLRGAGLMSVGRSECRVQGCRECRGAEGTGVQRAQGCRAQGC